MTRDQTWRASCQLEWLVLEQIAEQARSAVRAAIGKASQRSGGGNLQYAMDDIRWIVEDYLLPLKMVRRKGRSDIRYPVFDYYFGQIDQRHVIRIVLEVPTEQGNFSDAVSKVCQSLVFKSKLAGLLLHVGRKVDTVMLDLKIISTGMEKVSHALISGG